MYKIIGGAEFRSSILGIWIEANARQIDLVDAKVPAIVQTIYYDSSLEQ
jgi:hypothetical protein